jgi:NAD+ diphosphatase
MSAEHFIRELGPVPTDFENALWFPFRDSDLIVTEENGEMSLPYGPSLDAWGLKPIRTHLIGRIGSVPCLAAEVKPLMMVPGLAAYNLMELYGTFPEVEYGIAGFAFHIQHWERITRYCTSCGKELQRNPDNWVKICLDCGLEEAPRITPGVTILVHDGDRIALSRSPGWPQGRYGLIVSFVEPGESLEQCAARKVLEDLGLNVDRLDYFGSQPWPFPDQLMVGFLAHYSGGTLSPNPATIEQADWFRIGELPALLPEVTLARRMIDRFVKGFGRKISG